jgi:hypothetical protein
VALCFLDRFEVLAFQKRRSQSICISATLKSEKIVVGIVLAPCRYSAIRWTLKSEKIVVGIVDRGVSSTPNENSLIFGRFFADGR